MVSVRGHWATRASLPLPRGRSKAALNPSRGHGRPQRRRGRQPRRGQGCVPGGAGRAGANRTARAPASELLKLVANLDARANPTIAIPHQLSPAPIAVRRGIDWRWRNINWSGGIVIAWGRRPNNRLGSETSEQTSRKCSAFGLSVGWYGRADHERADRQNGRSIHVRLPLGWSTTYA